MIGGALHVGFVPCLSIQPSSFSLDSTGDTLAQTFTAIFAFQTPPPLHIYSDRVPSRHSRARRQRIQRQQAKANGKEHQHRRCHWLGARSEQNAENVSGPQPIDM